jgi:O-methyltransferase
MSSLQQASSGIEVDDAKSEVLDLILGYQISQPIHVAAVLGLADLLGAGRRTSTDGGSRRGASGVSVSAVGGGDGTLLASILSANSRIRGTLFDQPRAVTRAIASLDALGVSDRCEVLSGDFFARIPGGADAYLLKNILHDWDDEASAPDGALPSARPRCPVPRRTLPAMIAAGFPSHPSRAVLQDYPRNLLSIAREIAGGRVPGTEVIQGSVQMAHK